MDFYQFNFQDIAGRAALIWEQGNFIDIREERGCRIGLYDMGKFFAEIWFDENKTAIKMVRGFKGFNCLDLYLELGDLDKLLE